METKTLQQVFIMNHRSTDALHDWLLLNFKMCKICVEIGSPYYLRKSQVMNKKSCQAQKPGIKKIFWILIQNLWKLSEIFLANYIILVFQDPKLLIIY